MQRLLPREKREELAGALDAYESLCKSQDEISFKAGIKEVIDWGSEVCPGHAIYQYSLYRRQCSRCWQDKLKDWGIE